MQTTEGATALGAGQPPRLELLRRLWRTPAYRTILLAMVVMAFATSSGIPLIALYLVRDMGIGLAVAGLFFTGMAVPGLALGVLLGRRSDRWRSRLPFLRGATLWVALGWVVLALSPLPWLTLSVGAIFLSVGGALTGQFYATLHDVMTRDGEPQPQLINTMIRTSWSFGFVFGPVVGGVLATLLGFRVAFLLAGGLYLLCLLLLRRRVFAAPVLTRSAAPPDADARPTLLPFAFTALCALVLSGQTIRNTYLPLHVTTHLALLWRDASFAA